MTSATRGLEGAPRSPSEVAHAERPFHRGTAGNGRLVFGLNACAHLDWCLGIRCVGASLAHYVRADRVCRGVLSSALLNLPERLSTQRLFTVAALLVGLATTLIALSPWGPVTAVPLRF